MGYSPAERELAVSKGMRLVGVAEDSVVVPREAWTRLRELAETIDGAPCSFDMCPGPDEPYLPMATCNVCFAVQELRVAVLGHQPAPVPGCEGGEERG